PSSDMVNLDGLAGRKLVVTGGAGFIGSHLAARLVTLGADVHVVDDLSFGDARRVPERATLHCLDVRDADSLGPLFDGADVVSHLAAIASVQISNSSPLLTHSVNALGTVAVLEAARRSAVGRVVYASSSAVYGNQQSPSLSEDLTARPDNLYGLTKQEG